MGIIDSLESRRSIYALDKTLPVDECQAIKAIERTVELIPDAFDMKSQRIVIVLGAKQDILWDEIYNVFDGQVARAKIEGFKAAAGTVLYFIDESVVERLQGLYPLYADNFSIWAQQANGMLQIGIWTALRDLGIGANIQHYNPVIDGAVSKLFDIPSNWKLVAQMPFGGIVAEPGPKEAEDISQRVLVRR